MCTGWHLPSFLLGVIRLIRMDFLVCVASFLATEQNKKYVLNFIFCIQNSGQPVCICIAKVREIAHLVDM